MYKRSYNLEGREKWNTWSGVECEGRFSGVETYFIRNFTRIEPIPAWYAHYYILREAINQDLIAWALGRTNAHITLEVPCQEWNKVVQYLDNERITIQVVFEAPTTQVKPNVEVRFDYKGTAFCTTSHRLTLIGQSAPKNYENDRRHT